MREKLKSCPFCGSEAGIPTNLDGTPVDYEITDCSCKNDDCLLAGYWTPIKIWQTRPIEDDLRKRIAELEAENDQLTARWRQERQDDKWIPVSERLPEKYTPVWVTTTWGEQHSGNLTDDCWTGLFRDFREGEVTHWMPLPELPKESK